MLTDHAQTGDRRLWGLSIPQLCVVVGFVVATGGAGLVGALQLQRMQERTLRAEMTRLTDERMRLLRSSTLRCMGALHAMASFVAESPDLRRDGFRRFVRGPLERLPELQAFEWIPRASEAERAAFERAARRNDPETIERAFDAGCVDYVTKPFKRAQGGGARNASLATRPIAARARSAKRRAGARESQARRAARVARAG